MHNHPTPKFSVITVTYNAEAVLEDTIQSVISQTYRHVEYIIVDGASKDKTLSIIDRYKDHIAKVTSEPDKGLYDAMNKGIRLATGDYLCFLNAGDSFHEDDTLQQMVHTLPGSELPDVMYGETALYIIVDGASKDKTLSIIDRYKDHIAKVTSEPDKGLYDAMNKGIRLATGDYLCFLNAGDSFHEDDTLQQMVHTLPGSELPDVMYGETALVDKEGHFVRMRRLSAPETLTWKSFRQGMLVCHQAFFAKRTLVEPYNLKYRFSADFDWCIRIMKKAHTLHNTRLTIIDYLDEGMTTQNRKASLKERFRIMAQYYGLISTAAYHVWFVLRAVLKK